MTLTFEPPALDDGTLHDLAEAWGVCVRPLMRQVTDLATGSPELPATDAIILLTQADDRVIVRPSGTEPKLKCYLDAWSTDGSAAERLARAEATVAALDAGMRELLEG